MVGSVVSSEGEWGPRPLLSLVARNSVMIWDPGRGRSSSQLGLV